LVGGEEFLHAWESESVREGAGRVGVLGITVLHHFDQVGRHAWFPFSILNVEHMQSITRSSALLTLRPQMLAEYMQQHYRAGTQGQGEQQQTFMAGFSMTDSEALHTFDDLGRDIFVKARGA